MGTHGACVHTKDRKKLQIIVIGNMNEICIAMCCQMLNKILMRFSSFRFNHIACTHPHQIVDRDDTRASAIPFAVQTNNKFVCTIPMWKWKVHRNLLAAVKYGWQQTKSLAMSASVIWLRNHLKLFRASRRKRRRGEESSVYYVKKSQLKLCVLNWNNSIYVSTTHHRSADYSMFLLRLLVFRQSTDIYANPYAIPKT